MCRHLTYIRHENDLMRHSFPLRWLGVLRCPANAGRLAVRTITTGTHNHICDGTLECTACKRGYAIVRREGVVVRATAALSRDDAVDVQLAAGSFAARVTEVRE